MNTAAKNHTAGLQGSDASKKPVVLVIEDERTQRMILRAALERDGFEVEEAVDGLDGLRAYDSLRPDIVLMDVRMPGMDGFAACSALRRRAERLPILMLTILNDIESINRAYEAGATDFITKPVAWPVLGHRLRYMLRASKAFNELARSEIELLRRVAERTSELNAANAELEAFSYSVSHDLRAPLRAVRGFTAMLQSGRQALNAGEHELLDNILSHTKRMSAMIDDLLRLSRISRGNGLSRELTDLGSLVAQAVSDLRADYPRAAIKVSALPSARCDAGLMQQVFDNLIENALKYSAKKETPEIEIGMYQSRTDSVVFVRDNGIGFDPAQAQALFGVFRRFHAESDFPGTGVGLAIVKRIIERHGGRVWAQSAPGTGATFFFTLGDAAQITKPVD